MGSVIFQVQNRGVPIIHNDRPQREFWKNISNAPSHARVKFLTPVV